MALVQRISFSCLPFLRPLPHPSASVLPRFLSSNALPPNLPISASPAQSTIPSTQSIPKSSISILPYRVERTASSKLPIYVHAKSGGTRKETKLRKIEGDIDALRVQLRDALSMNDKDIVINRLTNHIIIKGWRKLEVAKFLEERQF